MNRELELLGKNIRYKKEYVGNDTYRLYIKKNEIELLENYLTELEQIKNTKPSEALECLEKVKNYEVENHYKEGWNIILYEEMQEELDTIKQALIKAERCLGARRNSKTLEQMYQLVQYSKPPMKPALWVAKVDGKLEQRVIMEKEEYNKKNKAWGILKLLCEVVETPVRKDRYLKINGVVVYTFKDKQEYDLFKEMLE